MDLNAVRYQIHSEVKHIKMPKYVISDIAPSTLIEVINFYKNTGKLCIWSGASDKTIWLDAQTNYLFRAWHDFGHIKTLGEFNVIGETSACKFQMSQVGTQFGAIIQHEVIGQLKYFETHGKFPDNQIEFFKTTFKF